MAFDMKIIDTGDEAQSLTNETAMIQDLLLFLMNYAEPLPYTPDQDVLPFTKLLVGSVNTPSPSDLSLAFYSSAPKLDRRMKSLYPNYLSTVIRDVVKNSRESVTVNFEIRIQQASSIFVTHSFTFGV